MKERDVLLGLHEMAGIGWHAIDRMKRAVGDLGRLAAMSDSDLVSLAIPSDRRGRDMGMKMRKLIHAASRDVWISERRDRLEKAGIAFKTAVDPDYPEWLRHIPQPPWVLYGIGRWSLLEQPVIAVVGTRSPTAYGKRIAYRLAAELSGAGWRIVSGMARGIDAEAHAGALTGPGKTVAVLATPVDTPYPRENAGLYRRIREEGLVLSETPPGTPLVKGLFPERNRIISGLSLGTVVVEADRKSGSLITASFALDQNRELFAVPGPVSSPKSAGTNKLIQKSHAKLVGDAADIWEEFPGWAPEPSEVTATPGASATAGAFAATGASATEALAASGTPEPPEVPEFTETPATEGPKAPNGRSGRMPATSGEGLTGDERKVLALMSDVPVSIDELMAATQFDFGHLHSVLLHLLMKKKIEQEPGSLFIRYH